MDHLCDLLRLRLGFRFGFRSRLGLRLLRRLGLGLTFRDRHRLGLRRHRGGLGL